ncbi:hypothetical protein BCR33DRAFT_465429 [Rhizoclosmatium globosum]|uniref:Uncharacterized protein n=1 Tax=Rhizoclosmatium globosum TaxID=329046 RepID=A0A1Y2BR17_9FUNG|nr:hypothetical protein BCR33DRAFT_465429 [Rhizoclosmatium globosum]|eukprot:ORY37191.1 hypothetical protein BCR33DRAFT_465429 [Rhizoclosmatium globosum]
MESESASTPVTPNKLIPLLLFGLRDPNSNLHIFARDIDAFRLLLKAISLLNFGVWIEHSVQPKDIKYASWKGNGFAKGMICFPERSIPGATSQRGWVTAGVPCEHDAV